MKQEFNNYISNLKNSPGYDKIIKKIKNKKIIRSKFLKKIINKILLIIFGIFIGLLILEIILQSSGFLFLSYKTLAIKDLENLESEKISILILGESTSEDRYLAWPRQLEEILNNKSTNMTFEIINKAIGGTNSAIILSQLNGYIRDYTPDIVITMMGINDDWTYTFYADNPPSKLKLFFENLKIVKLTRLIYYNFKQKNLLNKIQNKNDSIPSKALLFFNKGEEYFSKGSISKAESELNKAIEIYPEYDDVYVVLGHIERDYYKNFSKAIKYFEKALEINPSNTIVMSRIGETIKERNSPVAINLFQNSLKLDSSEKELVYNSLIYVYERENKILEIKNLLKKEGFSVKFFNDKEENTKYHYNLMYEILREKNITWIIMQYPTRDIEDFKNYFNVTEQKTLIFVENKENFEEVLKNFTYEEIFIDKFAFPRYSFGHCTSLGNNLIAKNVAEVILSEI